MTRMIEEHARQIERINGTFTRAILRLEIRPDQLVTHRCDPISETIMKVRYRSVCVEMEIDWLCFFSQLRCRPA